ncbi:MaoC family dehydratase [Microvirga makkahensis]|uniref:MaoC family dehydratase n=1 Tax=Microvirga makkahensis TaxID=1128670 RepID=A0A7X3SRY1_9HYPH|nr:MaoC family dehydratase [Microvirga makkahensis]MXQ14855.1 MaoC family dehydratase [Microvirga makkahensis]
MSVTRAQVLHPDSLPALVGHEVGISPWRSINQEQIDRFAKATDDHQFIHVDPDRAERTMFGGTIAHGFLTLSLLPSFAEEALPNLEGKKMGVNYGLDKVRFISPVRSGARIRCRFVLDEFSRRADAEIRLRHKVTVEIADVDKPALVAEWLTLAVF